MKHKRSIISLALATIMLVSLCAVYASTSVSATPSSSRANVAATPDLVGSPIAAGTGPAVCMLNGSGSMYVFVQGNDGALWYKIWNIATYSWTGSWVSLGGKLTASPAAVSRSDGIMDVYVRGADGQLYENFYNSAGWHTWGSLGGQLAPNTGPAASGLPSREDVFVEGTNGALYQKTWNSSSGRWSGWTNLGGQLTSSPATIFRYSFTDVFVRGSDGALYTKEYAFASNNWEVYNRHGGQLAAGTGPAACTYDLASDGTNRFDVFVEGTNGALYQLTWTQASGGYGSWTNLGGGLSASPGAATFKNNINDPTNIVVFVRGTNGLIYYKVCNSGNWWGWDSGITGPP